MGEPGRNIILYCLKHGAKGGFHSPGFSVRVQLAALNGENRLEFEHGSDGCGGRGDPPALFQIFQCVHCDIDTGVQSFFFQNIFNLFCGFSLFSQNFGVIYRLKLSYRDTVVVHDIHPSVVWLVFRHHNSGLAGIAQAGRHRDKKNLVIVL